MTTQPSLRTLLSRLARQERHDPHDSTVRLAVRLRARDACEYCLLPTTGPFQIDHVIPTARWPDYVARRLQPAQPLRARRGPDHLDNFAWCCPFCNVTKAEQVSHRVGRRFYRLFDPRRDRWPEHFVFAHSYLFIVGFTGIGQATERALGFNDPRLSGPLGTRHDAILAGRYPALRARRWLAETGR